MRPSFPGGPLRRSTRKQGSVPVESLQTTSLRPTLQSAAIKQLIDEAAIDLSSVDYLLYCTQTPDYIMPSTACLVRIGWACQSPVQPMDYTLGCSGFVYGLGLVKGLIESGQARNLLLVNADTYSKLVHPGRQERANVIWRRCDGCPLFRGGDEETLIGPFVYGTDGKGVKDIVVPAGAKRQPTVHDPELIRDDSGNARTVNNLYMNGAEVFNFTLRIVPPAVTELLDKAGLDKSAIDLFVFHQANCFMLEHLRRKLEIPQEKFVMAMEETGNTVSCSIPLALQQACKSGQLRPGALVMLVTFGVGYSWAATLIRWGNTST